MSFYLTGFHILRPRFEYPQKAILKWLAAAHAEAESTRQTAPFDKENFEFRLNTLLSRISGGDKVGAIKTRGVELSDIGHTHWDAMELFRLGPGISSHCLGKKTAFYGKVVDQFFETLYKEEKPLPEELIHITCTGYLSPSGAQKLVSNRREGRTTRVTHAYHMGCYASIPAIRIARGLIADSQKKADLVHTELCALHLDPFSHTPEQLVIESLFADGCIRYTLSREAALPSFRVIALQETILPDSTQAMTWQSASWGMQMSLKKEIPHLIAGAIEEILLDLASEVSLTSSLLKKKALFAIHPGGPKIIQLLATQLNLSPEQIRHTYKVLEKYGNMSSATLPHVWESLLQDPEVPRGTLIVSLAFGPGLTAASSLMEKL